MGKVSKVGIIEWAGFAAKNEFSAAHISSVIDEFLIAKRTQKCFDEIMFLFGHHFFR